MMPMSAIRRWLPILCLILVPACTLLPPAPRQPMHRYRLELAPGAVGRVPGRQDVVEIGPIRVFPAYATARIAYRGEGGGLAYHARHRWVDAPARQLAPLLADALAASGCCRAVVLPGAGVAPRVRLVLNLLRFEIDYRPRPAVFRLTARLQVVDVPNRRVLAARRLSLSEPLAARSPAAGVAAADRCLARLAAAAAHLLGRSVP
ncbi:MAG: hypothetical protein D6721_03875 [Gammaproteobacteria bacterium]|nr:MAG: hypothetical protein D6721_03875 [Gammaproteobacteria bacterium]